jgi:hypothetical protein
MTPELDHRVYVEGAHEFLEDTGTSLRPLTPAGLPNLARFQVRMQSAAQLQSPRKTQRHEPSTQTLSGKRNCGTVRHHPRRACFAFGVPLLALAIAATRAVVAGAQLQPEQVVKEDTVGNREDAGGALAAVLRENARLRQSLAGCERSKGHRATASGMGSGVLLRWIASLTRRNAMLVQEIADLVSRLEDLPSHGMPCVGHLAATASNAPEAVVLGGTKGPSGPPAVHHAKTQTLHTVPSSGALVGLPALPACGRPAVVSASGVGLSRRGHRALITEIPVCLNTARLPSHTATRHLPVSVHARTLLRIGRFCISLTRSARYNSPPGSPVQSAGYSGTSGCMWLRT